MDSVSKFLAMGGYAAYVWPALGLTALVLVGLLVASLRSLRAREAMFESLDAERPGRRERRARKEQKA